MEEYFSFIIDKDSRIISWGEQISRIMGKKPSSALGKKYHYAFPRLLSDGKDAASAALSGNKDVLLKGYPLTCPRESMTADVMISPIRDGKDVKGARVTISDAMCPVLQGIGKEQRFIDIGKTASTLAHGVRNPLNAMKGAVLYLSGKYKNERTLAEFAHIMEDEITRFDNFISRFLSTSLSDEESALTDINALLKKIQVLISFQTRFYNIRSHFEYGDILPVMVNSFQVEHAILNIINNSIEIMRSGGSLTVKTGMKRRRDGHYVRIEICDSGPGISRRRTSENTMPEDSGKGFGLIITREVLRYYGGHLEIESKKGKGTIANLYLAAKRDGGKQ